MKGWPGGSAMSSSSCRDMYTNGSEDPVPMLSNRWPSLVIMSTLVVPQCPNLTINPNKDILGHLGVLQVIVRGLWKG